MKKYAKYFRRHIVLIIIATFFNLLATLGSLYSISMTSQLVEELSNHNASNILNNSLTLFCVESISVLFKFLTERLVLKVKVSVLRTIHLDLASALANASAETVEKMDTAALTERLREAVKFLESVFAVYDELFYIFAGIIAIIYAFIKSVYIALLFIFSLIVILIFQINSIKRMAKKAREVSNASDNTKQLLIEIIDAFSAVKSQSLLAGLKPQFFSKIDNECLLNSNYESIHISNRNISSEILNFSKIAFILLGGLLATNGLLSFSEFVALFMYKGKIDSMTGSGIRIARNIASIGISIQRMDDVMSYKKISKEIWGSIKHPSPSGNISIQNVSANYGSNTRVLDNICLDIPSGKFIGIVGQSGCGKSTLLKILARQQAPVSGKILVDNIDMYSLDEWSYRKTITYAPQSPYLFSLSIRENLTLGNPNASDGAIWAALEECAAANVVRSKGGLDVVLTPKELSGGEQQRLSLSRLAIKGAKIVLMDESTSALDGQSQNVVIDTIKKAVKRGHTIILVAHRLSTLKDADMIVHLEDGRILETGTFSELYSKSAKFRRLADLS